MGETCFPPFPILVLIPAHVRSAQRDLYRAEVNTTLIITLVDKRQIWRFSLDALYGHIPSWSKTWKIYEKGKVNGSEIYLVLCVSDVEFLSLPRWKCSGNFFVPHRMERNVHFYRFWNIDFFYGEARTNLIADTNSLY